jgi:beta-glucosidase
MDLGRDPRWPRQWESYGEDPFLQAEMAREETLAIQGDDPNNVDLEHCAVSIKHFMGYGVPVSGKDRTPAIIAENDLREKFFAPFLECFRAGALTAMVNSASINGIPTHANEKVLTQWVKKDLGWDGMYVTDWADIDNLFVRDHVAADKKEAVALGINAGIDMIMDPYDITCCDVLVQCVNEGLIPMSRIDDAVRRILRLKVRLGLFDNPVWEHEYPEFASEQFARESYQAAVESEVLLKNDGILPLKGTEKILVCGPNANTLRAMNGGWSYTWQGSADDFVPQYNTIFEALFDRFPGKVSWVPGVVYDERFYQWEKDIAINVPQAVAAARKADVVICCVGENSYCETPGNTDNINLSANQKELVKAVAATGKPVILVLNEGRPRLIGDIEPLAKAVVDVMLPSNYGGNALAALLAGDENFSGKLPFTYSKHINALHTYDYKVSEHRETMEGSYNYDAVMDVQWPFGHGLSYTTFAYSDLNVAISSFSGLSRESLTFTADDVLKVSVKVTNTGSRAGKEAVLLYSSDLVASLIPDVKRLRGFEKIALEPGESKVVEFEVPAKALAFVGPDGRWRLEAGDFRLAIGGLGQIVTCTKTKVWDTPNI